MKENEDSDSDAFSGGRRVILRAAQFRVKVVA